MLALSFPGVTTNREVDTPSALLLRFVGGFVLNGLGTGTALAELDLGNLARLDRRTQLNTREGTPSVEFQLRWQRALEAIEAAVNSVNAAVVSQGVQIAALQAISAQAQAANNKAEQVNTRTSIEGSYTNPTAVLTASADGTITIAAHNRTYTDDLSSVAVNAGSISGLLNERFYTVFYSDAARAGGAVTYQAAEQAVAQGGTTHVVGRVSIPAIGNPPETGAGPTPPGYTPPPDGGSEPILDRETP